MANDQPNVIETVRPLRYAGRLTVESYDSLEDFLSQTVLARGIINIKFEDQILSIFNDYKGYDKTIVFFRAAISGKVNLPLFSGQGIAEKIEANCIYVSDPSLMLSNRLNLAWFVGNDKLNLQNVLSSVLAHLFECHDIERKVFFGASGGGFASLYYSSKFNRSIAVVANPQSAISKYIPAAVSKFLNICFRTDDSGSITDNLTLDLTEIYREKTQNTVAYIQNIGDRSHMTSHLLPFRQSIHRDNDFLLLCEFWGAGHVAPPKEILRNALIAALNPSASYALKDLGFESGHLDKIVDMTGHVERLEYARSLQAEVCAHCETVYYPLEGFECDGHLCGSDGTLLDFATIDVGYKSFEGIV